MFFNFLNFIRPEYMTLCVTPILEKGFPTHQWGGEDGINRRAREKIAVSEVGISVKAR